MTEEHQLDPRRWKALAVLSVAYLMVVLDISIVNVALPSIQRELHFSTENLQWIVGGYSLMCGLSTSEGMLITARILQGVGGAILSPSVFSIVTVTFQEGSERNKALGTLGAIAGSGAAIGVLLGGVLTEYAGWEWIFFVNVPVGFLTLLLVPRLVRESRVAGMQRHFDATGAVVVTGSLMMLVYALTQANNAGWGSLQTVGLLVG